MSRPKREQQYVDVIERVLGGVQIMSESQPRRRFSGFERASRELFGRRRSRVEVNAGREEGRPRRVKR